MPLVNIEVLNKSQGPDLTIINLIHANYKNPTDKTDETNKTDKTDEINPIPVSNPPPVRRKLTKRPNSNNEKSGPMNPTAQSTQYGPSKIRPPLNPPTFRSPLDFLSDDQPSSKPQPLSKRQKITAGKRKKHNRRKTRRKHIKK